jgi:hypothetical protein
MNRNEERWVIFSRSEALRNEGAGFWSNSYGWVHLPVASRFSAPDSRLPMSLSDDEVWMKEPEGMRFCRVILMEQGAEEPIAFECWAEEYDHAIEQAENAYPGCTVLTKPTSMQTA